jgi:hypothetical protein
MFGLAFFQEFLPPSTTKSVYKEEHCLGWGTPFPNPILHKIYDIDHRQAAHHSSDIAVNLTAVIQRHTD